MQLHTGDTGLHVYLLPLLLLLIHPFNAMPQTRSRSSKASQTQVKPTVDDVADKDPSVDHQATFEIRSDDGKTVTCQRFSTQTGVPALIFTHGASGGLTNPATRTFTQGFAQTTPAVCFQGTMNLQSRVKAFHAVIGSEKADGAALGGRSMGARAAVLAAKDHTTTTLVLVSYPLIGQNGAIRDQILLDTDGSLDVLFVSGDKDNMCPIEQLSAVRARMKARSWMMVVKGADHGMSMTPKSAVDAMREYTGKAAAEWLKQRDPNRTDCSLRWDADDGHVVDDGWHPAIPSIGHGKESKDTSHREPSREPEPSAKRRKRR